MIGSDTWGIDGTTFLALYAVLALTTLIVIWLVRRALIDTGDGGRGTPALDAYELAMLNGGPDLAITTAAAKLHGDGALASNERHTILAVARPADANDLEHEVYSAVERTAAYPSEQLRRRLRTARACGVIAARLTDAGLLLDDRRRRSSMRVGAGAAGARARRRADHRRLAERQAESGSSSSRRRRRRLGTLMPGGAEWATARGDATCSAAARRAHGARGRAAGAELPLAVALFGAGVLWLAAPELASAWAIPRDAAAAGTGGRGRLRRWRRLRRRVRRMSAPRTTPAPRARHRLAARARSRHRARRPRLRRGRRRERRRAPSAAGAAAGARARARGHPARHQAVARRRSAPRPPHARPPLDPRRHARLAARQRAHRVRARRRHRSGTRDAGRPHARVAGDHHRERHARPGAPARPAGARARRGGRRVAGRGDGRGDVRLAS